MVLCQRYSPHSNCRIQPPVRRDTSLIHQQAGWNHQIQALTSWDHKSAAEEVAIAAGQMLITSSREPYPIIMANEFGGVIFHEACGHLLETTQIERKTSPLREKGEQIAHESSAWDEGLSPTAFDN